MQEPLNGDEQHNVTPEKSYIERRIIAVWIATIVLSTCFAVFFLVYSRNGYLERSHSNSRNLVVVLQQHIKSDLEKADATIRTNAREYLYLKQHDKLSDAAIRQHMDLHSALIEPPVEFVHIADGDGNVVYGVNPQETLNIEKREFFQEAKNNPTPRLVVSKPLKGLRSGKWGIYLARRMDNPDGSFAGISYAAIRLESLRNVISSVVTGPGGSIVLRNTDMTFLTRFPEVPGSDADVGTLGKISKQLRSAMASGAEYGTITLFSPADNT